MDYVFFDAALRQEFATFAASLEADCTLGDDDGMGGDVAVLLASIDDDLPEATLDALENRYDELMDEQSVRAADQAGWVEKRLAGVSVTLDDGTVRTIRLDPAMANRLLQQLSAAEINDLVTQIARSLAGPEEPRLCKDPGNNGGD